MRKSNIGNLSKKFGDKTLKLRSYLTFTGKVRVNVGYKNVMYISGNRDKASGSRVETQTLPTLLGSPSFSSYPALSFRPHAMFTYLNLYWMCVIYIICVYAAMKRKIKNLIWFDLIWFIVQVWSESHHRGVSIRRLSSICPIHCWSYHPGYSTLEILCCYSKLSHMVPYTMFLFEWNRGLQRDVVYLGWRAHGA